MAKAKKTDEKKIVLERTYNVPLRREYLKVAKFKRSKKAVKALKEFLIKHMKSDKVKIGNYANLKIWEKGIKNPPHHIKVIAKKDEEGNVMAEIVGAPEKKKLEPKKEAKKGTTKEKKLLSEDEKSQESKISGKLETSTKSPTGLEKPGISQKAEKPKEETKKEETVSKLEEELADKKEEQQEKAKEIQKEGIKELQKEHPKQHAPKGVVADKNVEAKPNAPKGNSEARKP